MYHGIPGDSCNLIICLSEKWDRLWFKLNEYFVLQCVHTVGSAMRPRSNSTAEVSPQRLHVKKASHISGIKSDERITIPQIVTSWSISKKKKKKFYGKSSRQKINLRYT